MNLSTTYLSLKLANPIIVASGPLTCSLDGVRKCAANRAGAVVLRSLFEEQLRAETAALTEAISEQAVSHGEASEYLRAGVGLRYATRDYLQLIRAAKQETDLPVIASINCVTSQSWDDFAREVEAAGADALELNIALFAETAAEGAAALEARYARIVAAARRAVRLPIAVKLGPHFTSLPAVVEALHRAGAAGFVLFNRYYAPTIDIETMAVRLGSNRSVPSDLTAPLRATSLLSGRVNADFSANSGVHSGEDVVRAVLAGASAAHVLTALLAKGVEEMPRMLDAIAGWMERHGFASLSQFRGRLSQAVNPEASLFSRYQYMSALGAGGQ